jgi:hypothetical protein
MARKRHRDTIRNSCADHIAHGSPAEIVHQDWAQASRLASGRPRLAKIANWLAVTMEHERAIETARRVRSFHDFEEPPGKRQNPTVLVLADLGP